MLVTYLVRRKENFPTEARSHHNSNQQCTARTDKNNHLLYSFLTPGPSQQHWLQLPPYSSPVNSKYELNFRTLHCLDDGFTLVHYHFTVEHQADHVLGSHWKCLPAIVSKIWRNFRCFSTFLSVPPSLLTLLQMYKLWRIPRFSLKIFFMNYFSIHLIPSLTFLDKWVR